jgi:O-antigen ligase
LELVEQVLLLVQMALTAQHLASTASKDAWVAVVAADIQVVQETVVKEQVVVALVIIKAVVVVEPAVGAEIQQPTQTITTDQELPTMYRAKVMVLVVTVF